MNVMTFEGVVENGRILLKNNVHLPDKVKVFVIVPDLPTKQVAHIYSPRLVHPEQAKLLQKIVVEEDADDNSI